MNLPSITLPHYERALPSGKLVKFRPFTVAEEMILLQALESNDPKQLKTTTYQIIKQCVIEPANYAPDKEPWFDVDALLLFLRAYSVNTELDVEFVCNNMVGENKCGERFVAKFDLDNLVYEKPTGDIDPTIWLDENIGVKMKHPTYSDFKDNMFVLDNTEQVTNMLARSIESVFDKEAVYPFQQLPWDERVQWVKTLMNKDMVKIANFVNSAPIMHLYKKTNCPKCGFEHELRYTNFSDFFE
jgi:hypothetical protein